MLLADETPTGDDKRIAMDLEYLIRQLGKIMDETDNPTIRLRRQLCMDALRVGAPMSVGDRLV